MFASLRRDPLAFAAAVYLVLVAVVSLVGPFFLDPAFSAINLRARNLAPFQFDKHWMMWLGADSLGRAVLGRLIQGAQTTLLIASSTVLVSLVVGTLIGLLASLRENWLSAVLMRGVDVLMSIPSLLLAILVLYSLGGHPANVVLVLSITRIPAFARTARSEALEIRERAFVSAARVMGAGDLHVLLRHIVPMVLPTMLAISALEFAVIMLGESTLTFLGLGIQPPDVTWGLMVAEGRDYLSKAWWISFWPGMMIASIALSATILGNWFRVAGDPSLRSRFGSGVAASA